jgi:hypothetical protein
MVSPLPLCLLLHRTACPCQVTFLAVDFLGLKINGSSSSADGSSAEGMTLLLSRYRQLTQQG